MNKTSLIVLGGFAGAGKTTIANRLSAAYNYPVISTDVINDILRDVLQKSFSEVSPISHAATWQLVRQQLENSVTTIVDTNMCSDATWRNLDKLQEQMPDITIVPIILQCTLDTHQERIKERGRTNKQHLNLGGYAFDDIVFKYHFIEALERPDLIRIDADGQPDEVYASVRDTLETHGALRL